VVEGVLAEAVGARAVEVVALDPAAVVVARAAAARVEVEEAVAPVAAAAGIVNSSRSSGASLVCDAPFFY
jgi:predicted RNA methylase